MVGANEGTDEKSMIGLVEGTDVGAGVGSGVTGAGVGAGVGSGVTGAGVGEIGRAHV